MKYWLMLSLLLGMLDAFGQWNQVTPLSGSIMDVAVTDDSTSYLLCTSPDFTTALFRSINGARTWAKLSEVSPNFSRIFFVDSLNGFGVSRDAVYKTTDGAVSWVASSLPVVVTATAIQFTSAEVGYIATSDKGILKTTDGGLTWNFLSDAPSKTRAYSSSPLSFFNNDIGYVVGESGLFRTEDGGSTWTAINMFAARNVFAATADLVYVSTNYETRKSADRGHSWVAHYYSSSIPVYPPGKKGLLFEDYSRILQAADDDATITTIYQSKFTFSWRKVSSAGNLILATGTDGALVTSRDAGNTWTLINCIPQHGNFVDVHFVDKEEGFIIGPSRGFLRTHNNGVSWEYDESPWRDDLYQLAFCHPDTGFVVLTNNYAMTTHDGGKTFDFGSWTPPIIGDQSSKDYEMVTANIIYTTGAFGKVAKSVDGGRTWQTSSLGFSNTLYSIDCVNRDTCHAVGAVGKIVSTRDGGATWMVQNDIPVNQDLVEIHMLNPSIGFASGNNVLVRTTDGGHTWSVLNVSGGPVRSFMFTSGEIGYAVTGWGYVLKTEDQGATWKTGYAPPSNSLEIRKAFLRDSTIFAIGNSAVYSMQLGDIKANSDSEPNPDPDPGPVTGLENHRKMVNIHPNPTDGLLHISALEPIIAVEVRDARGKLVHRSDYPTSSLEVYDLPPGVYILHVIGRSESWTGKIMRK